MGKKGNPVSAEEAAKISKRFNATWFCIAAVRTKENSIASIQKPIKGEKKVIFGKKAGFLIYPKRFQLLFRFIGNYFTPSLFGFVLVDNFDNMLLQNTPKLCLNGGTDVPKIGLKHNKL